MLEFQEAMDNTGQYVRYQNLVLKKYYTLLYRLYNLHEYCTELKKMLVLQT